MKTLLLIILTAAFACAVLPPDRFVIGTNFGGIIDYGIPRPRHLPRAQRWNI